MQRKNTTTESTTGILSTLNGYWEYIQPTVETVYTGIYTGAKAAGKYIASKWNASPPVLDTKLFHRKHVAYKTNRTAGIAVRDRLTKKDAPKDAFVEKIYSAYNANKKSDNGNEDLNVKLVELFADRIKEHASRRVDLFFYLLVAVYKKQVIVHKKATIKQHGEGEKYLDTHACHSSLFPHVKLESIPSRWPWLTSSAPCLTLSGTHFEETSNMTMELPDIVNKFDNRLEGTLQHPNKSIQICLEILNKTSRGEITPKQGLNEFLQMMNRFFEEFDTKSVSMKKVCDHEKSGTFMTSCTGNQIDDNYFYTMLRIFTNEKRTLTEKELEPYYQKIQDEIFSSKPVTRGLGKKSTK